MGQPVIDTVACQWAPVTIEYDNTEIYGGSGKYAKYATKYGKCTSLSWLLSCFQAPRSCMYAPAPHTFFPPVKDVELATELIASPPNATNPINPYQFTPQTWMTELNVVYAGKGKSLFPFFFPPEKRSESNVSSLSSHSSPALPPIFLNRLRRRKPPLSHAPRLRLTTPTPVHAWG